MAQPLLLTVNGTGVPDPFGPGFSGDLGRALGFDPWQALFNNKAGVSYASPFFWQPIGYPAAVTPMGPSVQAGVAEVSRQVTLHEQDGSCPPGTPLALSGYSQGALVTDIFWRDYVLSPKGLHHNRLKDVVGIVNFGDPMRCPGLAHGNEIAGLPAPTKLDGVTTGGIAGGGCLTAAQTPSFLLSCALDGDLYACAPIGDTPWTSEAAAGAVETQIFQIIQQATFIDVIALAKDIGRPVATVEAIYNAMKFFIAGTAAPHWAYQPFVQPMINWLIAQV